MEREKWRKDYDIYFSFLFQQNYRRIEYIIDPRLSLFVFTVNFAREIEIDKIFSFELVREEGEGEEGGGHGHEFEFLRIGGVSCCASCDTLGVDVYVYLCPDRLCPFARGGGGEVIIEKGERDGL